MSEIVIVGAGGHGREIAGVVNRLGKDWTVRGFVDDGPVRAERLARLGHAALGPLSWLDDHPATCVLGIGSASARRTLAERFHSAGCAFATVVAPTAAIGADNDLGVGVVVLDQSTITTNVVIGDHTHLNVACAVQHDTVVGSFVQFSPGVLVNGDCTIGDGVFLGSGAVVTRGTRIGDGATVGAGAVVLQDVSAGAVVYGIPARERSDRPLVSSVDHADIASDEKDG